MNKSKLEEQKCKTVLSINIEFEDLESCNVTLNGKYIYWDEQKDLMIEKLHKVIKYIENQHGLQGFLNALEDRTYE